jgi:outer membrane protein assembly factor BamB
MMSHKPSPKLSSPLVIAAAIFAALLALSGCGGGGGSSSASGGGGSQFGGSAFPGVDVANTRQASGPISKSNVSKLKVAWSSPISGQGTYGSQASPPVISDGVIYSQDLASNVQAIDLDSGEVLWTASFEQPSHGPNGVVVADGEVFGATPTEAFALDQETGEELWTVKLANNSSEGIDMAPGYHEGMVYVSTVPVTATTDYEPAGVGILWALDGKTGDKIWHFNTVPNDLWSKKTGSMNAGGGLWYQPSFDDKGSMYIGVGNPAPIPGTEKYPWGGSRPGPNLYTDSVVKLDAKTGKMRWHYQVTPHDLSDWDLQNPPILVNAGGKQMVIGSGKSGIVVALDQATGKLLWKRSVGKHNGHDKDGLYAMRGETSKLKLPMTIYPGSLGGVVAPMSTNGKTLFVPIVNSPLVLSSQTEKSEPGPYEGEIVALDVATGKVKWSAKLGSPAYGYTTAVNDLVFVTASEGSVYALDANTGGEVWSGFLPAGTNTGVTIDGETMIVPAGLPQAEGQVAKLVAYRLGG